MPPEELIHGRITTSIVEALPCPMIMVDLQGAVTLWNRAAELATGWNTDEVIGKSFPAIHERYREKFQAILEEVAAGEGAFSQEFKGQKKDGTGMRILFSSSPVFAESGSVKGVLATFVDQSARERRVEAELIKGNDFIEQVLDNLPVGISLNTIDKGRIGYANELFLKTYGGWNREDFTDLETFFKNIYPNADEREEVRTRLLRDIASGDLEKMQWDDLRITTKEGVEKILAVRNIPLRDLNLMISTVQDVTVQKLTERALRESERRYQVMAEASPVGIFRLDPDGRLCHVNRKWREISGRMISEVMGQGWDVAVHPDDLAESRETWQAAVRERRAFKVECRFQGTEGRTTWVFCQAEPIFGPGGEMEGFIGSVTDISRRKRTEEEIRQLAYYDSLTKLPNRQFFMEQLDRAMATARRNQNHVALLFCDLDNFKDVNDSLGHDKGDLLLMGIAERLNRCIRRGDTLCRLGGDEFVLMLPDVEHDREAVSVARKIQKAMKSSFNLDGHEVYSTTSIGIAVHPEDGADGDALLKHADTAMYAAKGKGRNRYQFYSAEMNQRAQERLILEAGLRQAMDKQELSLAWQPQYDLASGRLVGVEALLRWEHPELGMVSPNRFVPLAEETGLIHSIGRWVLEKACGQVQQWRQNGLEELRVAVNLSAGQFLEPDVVGLIKSVLDDTGLPGNWLELEITESALMVDADVTMRNLHCLREDGVSLAIDNFGTGYSSLVYLKNYPVNRIKMARTFVQDILSNNGDRAIAETMVAMAHNLDLKIIAEGVESAEQAGLLRGMGCDEGQGFHFGPPLTVKAFSKLI